MTHEVVGVFREHWAYSSAQGGARARVSAHAAPRRAAGDASTGCAPSGPPPECRLSRASSRASSCTSAVGGFAFLLRDLTWPQAAAMAAVAFLFNWQVLPAHRRARTSGAAPTTPRGTRSGIFLYPLAVLGLVLFFRNELWMAAAVWGVLALGDGMASIVGQAVGGPRLPWNPRKGWAGLFAFVVFGTAAAAVLMAWTLGCPWISGPGTPRARSPSPSARARLRARGVDPHDARRQPDRPLVGALVLPSSPRPSRGCCSPTPGSARALPSASPSTACSPPWRFALARSTCRGAISAIAIGTTIMAGARPARLRAHGRVLRARDRSDAPRLRAEGGPGHRAGEGRSPGLAERVGQRRRSRASWRCWPASAPAAAARRARARLRGGGGHRGRGHVLVRGRQGVRPADVPDHEPAAGAPGHGRGRQPRRDAGRPARRRRRRPRSARVSACTRGPRRAARRVRRRRWAAWRRASWAPSRRRRGWMGNDLLNAFNTAMGAVIVVACS